MKRTYSAKSSYQKLYLIEEEMYNRILPLLNEVEKQELIDLNESNRPYNYSEENVEEKNYELSMPEKNKDEIKATLNSNNLSPNIPTEKPRKREKK